MATFGVTITHTTPADGDRENRWWVSADTLGDALDCGESIISAIVPMFGEQVLFKKVHAWVPNSTPNNFLNRSVSAFGSLDANAPTSAIVCVKMEMGSNTATYPNAKYFRVCMNPAEQSGRNWGSIYFPAPVDVAAALLGQGFLVTEDGSAITSIVAQQEVEYRQLSKRWYNRTS